MLAGQVERGFGFHRRDQRRRGPAGKRRPPFCTELRRLLDGSGFHLNYEGPALVSKFWLLGHCIHRVDTHRDGQTLIRIKINK